jgi:hypothetical protein
MEAIGYEAQAAHTNQTHHDKICSKLLFLRAQDQAGAERKSHIFQPTTQPTI